MSTGTYLAMALAAVGYRRPGINKFMHAADELHRVANELRSELEAHKETMDPFGNLLSSMYNNHEFEKYAEHLVDTGTKPGAQASPNRRPYRPTW